MTAEEKIEILKRQKELEGVSAIAELLNAGSAYKEKHINSIANDIKQTGISFEHVNFTYKKEDGQVLHDINLEIPPGTVTALVGPSGSGKSTIAQLLAGFYPVTDGRIAIAVSLMMDKEILLFDEPTSGLDYKNMLLCADFLKKLRDKGKIVIVVSHDEEFIDCCCDEIYRLS
ncbi:ATP-binding cassette domain-containing protein [Butyrivibrio sp. AC2005]|uniref:ATP-binding cassette domain-containing protein n=1 Tax=Butyrivibrio sp. AC2005 TaxID=1280672 RepID=UPI0004220A10